MMMPTTRQRSRRLDRAIVVAVLAACSALRPSPARAQVGDTTGVTYPGWIPADKVVPVVTPTVTYDAASQLWRYAYRVANGASAAQEIIQFHLRYSGATAEALAPAGWYRMLFNQRAALPGVHFAAELSDERGTSPNGPAAAQIPAGQALDGFVITSAYPPGYARLYVRGFAPIPYPPDDLDEASAAPDDTTDAQRRWVLGPTRYTAVLTDGNRRPSVDGFLGFMNLAEGGATTLTAPAPVALEFSVAGETVFRETLTVTLNGVDVTAAFRPGPADGADLVAVFELSGDSPLKVGKNILLTSVEGLLPGTTRRAKDADRMTFTLQP